MGDLSVSPEKIRENILKIQSIHVEDLLHLEQDLDFNEKVINWYQV